MEYKEDYWKQELQRKEDIDCNKNDPKKNVNYVHVPECLCL